MDLAELDKVRTSDSLITGMLFRCGEALYTKGSQGFTSSIPKAVWGHAVAKTATKWLSALDA
jgi:hypothetical protein